MGNAFAAARRAWDMEIGTDVCAEVEPMAAVVQVLSPMMPRARVVGSSVQS